MADNFIGFTIDMRKLGAVCRHDPSAVKEFLEGLKADDAKPTDPVGASAMRNEAGECTFYTLYVGTLNTKKPGEAGYFQRNDAPGCKGDRVRFRMRQQEKRHQDAARCEVQQTLEMLKARGLLSDAATAVLKAQGLLSNGNGDPPCEVDELLRKL